MSAPRLRKSYALGFHTCPVPGCTALIANKYALCGKHWRWVPVGIQLLVTNSWKNRLKGLPGAREWHLNSVRQAVEAVIAREGKGVQ